MLSYYSTTRSVHRAGQRRARAYAPQSGEKPGGAPIDRYDNLVPRVFGPHDNLKGGIPRKTAFKPEGRSPRSSSFLFCNAAGKKP
jgi:hypothetical protein